MTRPDEDLVVFRSRDWTPAAGIDAPLYAFQYEALLEQCEAALALRRKAYPQQIARNQIPTDVAERDIRGWELLCGEWRWILTGEGEAPAWQTMGDRMFAVELALSRVRQELDRGNRSHDMHRRGHILQALIWHLRRLKFGAPAVHYWAELSRACRADADAKRLKPAITANKEAA